MKKVIVALFAGLLLGAHVSPVKAQGMPLKPASLTFSNTGTKPQVNLNSTGSNWGQVSNPSADVWALGFGAADTAVDQNALYWGVSGSSGAVSIGTSALGPAALVVQSTSTATASLQAQSSAGTKALVVYGDGGVLLGAIKTKAQLQALTASVVGEAFICSDCSNKYALEVATGTASADQFREQGTSTGVQ